MLLLALIADTLAEKDEQTIAWLPSFHMYSSDESKAAEHNTKALDMMKKGFSSLSKSSLKSTDTSPLNKYSNVFADIDNVEGKLTNLYNVAKKLAPYAKASLGTALLIKGKKLANTALVIQALSIAGLPALKKATKELRRAYRRGRKQIEEEMPNLVAAQKDISNVVKETEKLTKDMKKIGEDLQKNLADLKSSFDAKKITKESLDEEKMKVIDLYEKKKGKIQEDIDALNQSKEKFLTASSSVRTILSTIQPDHLKIIFMHLYSSLLSTLAVARSDTAQKVTRGLHFANVIQDSVTSFSKEGNNVFTRLIAELSVPGVPSTIIEKGSTWLASVIHSAAASGGIFLSFFMKDIAQSYSVSILGSDLLLKSLEEILDPICEKFKFSGYGKVSPFLKTITHSGIVWLAVAKQTALARKLPESGPILKLFLKLENAVTDAFF